MNARDPQLQRTSLFRDLRELRNESRSEAEADYLPEAQKSQFFAVTGALSAALGRKPALTVDPALAEEHRWAVEQIYMATTAEYLTTTEHISGIERSAMFNRALMILQPVLAVALRPDFAQGRPIYSALSGQVVALRKSITSSIVSEMMPRKRAVKKTDESDTDEADDVDADASGDSDDEASADSVAEASDDASAEAHETASDSDEPSR